MSCLKVLEMIHETALFSIFQKQTVLFSVSLATIIEDYFTDPSENSSDIFKFA
jgi:hypothetical protein